MAVAAQIDILPTGKSERGTIRHQVRLRVRSAPSAGEVGEVLIHNLSATGLLLECASQLEIGDEILVELPEAEASSAKVVWASGQFFGCAFDRPLSPAAVSAAQLRSEPTAETPALDATVPGPESAARHETFGARLQRLRRDRGFTLVEFARRARVSRPTVWSWEADRSTPRRSKTKTLLEVLGVTEDELFGVTGAGASEHPAEHGQTDRGDALQRAIHDAKERVADLAGTSPEKVKLIIEI